VSDSPPIGSILRWGAFASYLALTFYLSSRTNVPGASLLPDYVLHAAEFAILAALLLQAVSGRILGGHGRGALWATFLFGAGYAVLDEVHQSFIPGRDASVRDAVVDVVATGLTVAALGAWSRIPGAGAPDAS
jgi:VanZ family protein